MNLKNDLTNFIWPKTKKQKAKVSFLDRETFLVVPNFLENFTLALIVKNVNIF